MLANQEVVDKDNATGRYSPKIKFF